MLDSFASLAASGSSFSSAGRVLAANYDRFSDLMKKQGYDWEQFNVTTDDGYILTTFHLLNKTGETFTKATKGTVLVQHGAGMDGASFFEFDPDNKSWITSLVDEGYDVWLGNNRGTMWS